MPDYTRRTFLQALTATSLAGAGVSGLPSFLDAFSEPEALNLDENTVILFQGDSITDAGRDRSVSAPNQPGGLGHGYAFLTAAPLLHHRTAQRPQCYNRGVSGDTVADLAARWEEDCLALQPDVLSILIGVNDFWHTLDASYEGTAASYERGYRVLLERTREALPDIRLILGEPYALRGGSAVSEDWYPAFPEYQAAAREIARDVGAAFIPYQSVYDEAQQYAPATYWSADGVHPSLAGAHLMAQAWLSTFQEME